jgi:hypothetical protein
MKTFRFTSILLIGLFILTTSCFRWWDCIDGVGEVQTDERVLDGFNEIVSEGSFDVYVNQGNDYSVTVEAQSNLLPYIVTEVNGDKLDLHTLHDHCISSSSSVKVYVTCPDIYGLKLAGSGKIECGKITTNVLDVVLAGSGDIIIDSVRDVDNLDINDAGSGKIDVKASGNYVEASIAGSGDIILSGSFASSKLTISGSGKIDANAMQVDRCEAIIAGSGRIYTDVNVFLKVTITGSGDVYYRGHPDIDLHITGSGDIRDNN